MSQDLILNNESNIAYMKAELDTAIMTAQLIKRDINVFMDEATKLITYNEEIAASCIFSLPRKKKNEKTGQYEQTYLKGKSVRLSEIILTTYENITVGSRIIEVTPKTVTVEGCAWDLQKRVKFTAEVTENINGTHADAAKLAIGSATSKAIRNAIFRIVGPLADVLYKKAVDYLVGDQKTFPAKRAYVFERLKVQGIEPEKIFFFYDKTCIEDFTPELVEELIGIGTAIKEGELKIDKAFVKVTAGNDAQERIDNLTAQPEPPKAPDLRSNRSSKPPTVNQTTGEITPQFSFDDVKNELQKAGTEDALHVAADKIRSVEQGVLQEELQTIYRSKLEALKK